MGMDLCGDFEVAELMNVTSSSCFMRSTQSSEKSGLWKGALPLSALLLSALLPLCAAQSPTSPQPEKTLLRGRVLDATGKPVDHALVQLQPDGLSGALETTSDAAGGFSFSVLPTAGYRLSARKAERCTQAIPVDFSAQDAGKPLDLLLSDAPCAQNSTTKNASAARTMEFADGASFTVAGVMDWTAAGGHGSDSSLRTSEALTRETLRLKAETALTGAAEQPGYPAPENASEKELLAALASAPGSFEANQHLGSFYLHAARYREAIPPLQTAWRSNPADRANEYDLALALRGSGEIAPAREHVQKLLAQGENAELHRLAGELDEQAGDPLAAVREFEEAVRLDRSEENYFAWGSELLLHRAVLQAQEVFRQGAAAYPESARMLTALGTALFSGARYDEAAQRLCAASDLNPAAPDPYLFMGKIEIAAPNPLACVQEKLARFAHLQPQNPLANFYYAMALWKAQTQMDDQRAMREVELLLTKAVTLDPLCADAFLQLGNLLSTQRNYAQAIGYYRQAIAVNPQLDDAHYRLGVAYDRVGDHDKAKQEFQMHDNIRKQQAADVDKQRREVKQFQISGQPIYPSAH